MKKILIFIMCLLLIGCSNTKEKKDIEEIKKTISNSEYQISFSKEGEDDTFLYNWKISDKTNEQAVFRVYVDEDNKEVLKMHFAYAINNNKEYSNFIYMNNEIQNVVAVEKANEILKKDNLQIIDLIDYSSYCLKNDYYDEFRN